VSPKGRSGGKTTSGRGGADSGGTRREKDVAPDTTDPALTLGDHDPEGFARRGMSEEALEVDEAETMASSGNASNSFQEIVSGSATGLGIDRAETLGTGGLAAGEDADEVAEGDWWRRELEDPELRSGDRSAERYDLEGRRLGWETAVDFEERQHGLDNKKTRLAQADHEPPTGVPEDSEDE
jgi:hypothetical protein